MPIIDLYSFFIPALFIFTALFTVSGLFLNRSPADQPLFPFISTLFFLLLYFISAPSPFLLPLTAAILALLYFSARGSPLSGVLTFGLIHLFDIAGWLNVLTAIAPAGFSFLLMRAHDSFVQSRDAAGTRDPLTLASLKSDLTRIFSVPALPFGPVILKDRFESLQESLREFSTFYENASFFLLLGTAKVYLLIPFLKLNFETGLLPFRFTTDGVANLLHSGLYKYALLYLDFSACADIAVGFAGLLGMRIEHNFRHPYLAVTLADFWGRWNITVVEWIGRYLFGMKGDRIDTKGIGITAAVIFAAGIWHGLTVKFALWGLLHGGAVSLEGILFRKIDRNPRAGSTVRALRFLMTQGFVMMTANLLI